MLLHNPFKDKLIWSMLSDDGQIIGNKDCCGIHCISIEHKTLCVCETLKIS